MYDQSRIMLWVLATAGSLANGKSVQAATSNADQALKAFESRFSDQPKSDDET